MEDKVLVKVADRYGDNETYMAVTQEAFKMIKILASLEILDYEIIEPVQM